MDLSFGEMLEFLKTLNSGKKTAIGKPDKRFATIVVAGLIALAIKSTENYYRTTKTE